MEKVKNPKYSVLYFCGQITRCMPTSLKLRRDGSQGTFSGFTMVEILVVISIVVGLTSVMLLYGRASEEQLILFKEQSKLVSMVYRAKALSIETFTKAIPPCGYGVHFDPPSNYLIFRDVPPPTGCKDSDKKYSAAGVVDDIVERYNLSQGITFAAISITDVLFIPPDPQTLFTYVNPLIPVNPVSIVIQAPAGGSLNFLINNAGQITLP